MSTSSDGASASETSLSVRYWAGARAAAGVAQERVEIGTGTTLDALVALLVARHGPELERVLAVCSVLVGERPVGRAEPGEVTLRPGDSIEFLPPFAGG